MPANKVDICRYIGMIPVFLVFLAEYQVCHSLTERLAFSCSLLSNTVDLRKTCNKYGGLIVEYNIYGR